MAEAEKLRYFLAGPDHAGFYPGHIYDCRTGAIAKQHQFGRYGKSMEGTCRRLLPGLRRFLLSHISYTCCHQANANGTSRWWMETDRSAAYIEVLALSW